MRRRTYNDAFPKGGIFYYLDKRQAFKFHFPYSALDRLMKAQYGERLQSPLLQSFDDGNGVSHSDADSLAISILTVCQMKWERLYKASVADYDPVSNYDMIETERIDTDASENETGTIERTTENATTHSDRRNTDATRTERHSGTDGVVENVEGSEDKAFHGFNSQSTGKPYESGTGENHKETSTTHGEQISYEDNETVSGTANDTLNGTETASTTSDRDSNTVTARTLTRSGNIGVMTAAQMIKGEIDLWSNFSFWPNVMEDVADILTLSVFEQ